MVSLLRNAGVSADIGLTEGKVGNQFKYASRLGYTHAVTVGGSEMAARTANFKDMTSGEETRGMPIADVISAAQAATR